jgi:uncharacterized protein
MTTRSVVIFDGDVPLAGRIHRHSEDPFEQQPAVIVMGSWLTVKEQMADLYAAALAERGYTAITFDFSGFGTSGGTLRQAEVPARKVANIIAVADYVSRLSYVAPGGPGLLAICASAQYSLEAIARGAGVASFASVAGWFHDARSVAGFYGGAQGVAARLDRASSAADHFLDTGEVRMVPAYAVGDESAGMFIDMDYYSNPARGAIREWRNEMAELSWSHWLTYNGLAAAGSVHVPTVFVHSDGCVFPDNIRAIAAQLAGPVDTVWGQGAQIDFYDQPDQTTFALEAADTHFKATLGHSA